MFSINFGLQRYWESWNCKGNSFRHQRILENITWYNLAQHYDLSQMRPQEDFFPRFGLFSFLFFFFVRFCSFMFSILLFSMIFQVQRSLLKCFLHLPRIVIQMMEKKVWITNAIVNGMIGLKKKINAKIGMADNFTKISNK